MREATRERGNKREAMSKALWLSLSLSLSLSLLLTRTLPLPRSLVLSLTHCRPSPLPLSLPLSLSLPLALSLLLSPSPSLSLPYRLVLVLSLSLSHTHSLSFLTLPYSRTWCASLSLSLSLSPIACPMCAQPVTRVLLYGRLGLYMYGVPLVHIKSVNVCTEEGQQCGHHCYHQVRPCGRRTAASQRRRSPLRNVEDAEFSLATFDVHMLQPF